MNQQEIALVVQRVIEQLNSPQIDGDSCGIFDRLEDAVSAAQLAQTKIGSVALRDKIIHAIRKTTMANARLLSEMAVAETGFGRVEDKYIKHRLQAMRTPGTEAVIPQAISGDNGLSLLENAPWGVIASVTPSTNPSATVINNSISMIAGGNAVVFAPHPAAKAVSQKAVQLINEAVVGAGGPANLVTTVTNPDLDNANKLFTYDDLKLLVVTGGDAVVDAARAVTHMRLIAAGPGNPPVVVDETANIERAAVSIVQGASFDNNIICADEKEIIVVESVADQLMAAMCRHGAVEITSSQAEAVAKLVLKDYPQNPRVNSQWVGKDAAVIAEAAGFNVPQETRLLVVEGNKDHVFAVTELMMPVIAFIRASDVDQAIDWGVALEQGNRHTAAMHSTNIDNLSRMAYEINCSLFVKNGPCLAGLGAGGEGWTSMTISTPTGEGVTNAATFVRKRRCTMIDSFRIV
ncbi:Gamma-glutamyl phosphate reductase [Sinobacterium norvegicum]|uniref:Gamma-glutamyl phosphate reductase n=1 Tax=Sinobacterium norvegicum TaxID=1641715 RepID=A0ABM9AB71_9GAMM|nr:aldehyde dehydrogenase family protein [Sinobacterium norvegicum]CAH0990438.1 Gamma-glutamyl phosphate reductase [Sinobacterium norvegicum]